VAQIQSEITKLMQHVTLIGAGTSNPTDVAGQQAYSVSISPKHSGGLIGSAQLAWDAVTGVPLDVAVFARNDNTNPVLELKATNITYGPVSSQDLSVPMPTGDKVVKVSSPGTQHAATGTSGKGKGKGKHAQVSGVAAVSRKVPFALKASASLDGLPRHGVSLLDWGGKPAALVTYGQDLGGIAVIEQSAPPAAASSKSSQSQSSNLSLPTVSINGASGQELATALGTVLRFTKGGVAYTVIGSVGPYAAETAARALTKPGP
jgi:hypothetical protein